MTNTSALLGTLLFLLLPVVFLCLCTVLYPAVGKKQFFSLDLMLSIEAFLLFPLFALWIKYMIHMFIPEMQFFLFVESIVSTLLLYLYAAVVIHLFTKSLSLYHHARSKKHVVSVIEFYHHEVAHISIYGGAMLLWAVFSLLNLVSPIPILATNKSVWITIPVGILVGLVSYQAVLNYRGRGERQLQSILLTLSTLCLMLHGIGVLFLDPSWQWSRAFFWISTPACITFTLSLGTRRLLLRQRK